MASRRGWIADFAGRVWETALDEKERSAAAAVLGPPFQDEVGRALVVAEACLGDAQARPPAEIAENMHERGLTTSAALEELVAPVVKRYRSDGAPWDRYWDVDVLHISLLELWAASRRAAVGETQAAAECARCFGIQKPETIQYLLQITDGSILGPSLADPVAFPATAAFFESPAGRAMLHEIAEVRSLDGYPGRPDLTAIRAGAALARRLKETNDAAVAAEVETWAATQKELLVGLSAYETELLAADAELLAWAEILDADRRNYHATFLTADALPNAGDTGTRAPGWMQDDVISGGYRMWHGHIAPYALWFATAESDEQSALFRSVAETGHLAFSVDEGGGTVGIDILLDPDHPEGALAVPFTYSVAYPSEAFELLHLAASGRVRLMLLELPSDDELTVIGAVGCRLPADLCRRLGSIAFDRLRGIEDPEELRRHVAGLVAADYAGATFHAVDQAKAEDLLLDLSATGDSAAQTWVEYRQARTDLAAAWAQASADLLDGADSTQSDAVVRRMARRCASSLEVARRTSEQSRSLDKKLADLAEGLPDDETAFVHLYEKDGYVGAAWLMRGPAHEPEYSRVDLSHVRLDVVRQAVDLWQTLGAAEHRDAAELLAALAEMLTVVVVPVVADLPDRVSRLILSPTPPFDALPLHAATVDGAGAACLLDLFDEVVYAPSLRSLNAIAARPPTPHGKALLVAHSGGELAERLTGPSQEAAVLSAIYGDAVVLLEEDASPDRVVKAVAGQPVVHIASHAFTSSQRWASGLLLEGASFGTATLTAARVVADCDFTSAAVVVLAGCRTGAHEERRRTRQTLRGVDGAFLTAGAKAVLSTLWEVGDATSLVFGVLFHALFSAGASLGQAHRIAVAYLRQRSWALDTELDSLPVVGRVEQLLDQARPAWRASLDAEEADSLSGWAAFKLTGAPW